MYGRQGSVRAVMVLALAVLSGAAAPQEQSRTERRQRERLAQGQRLEGQAMLALADAAMASPASRPAIAPSVPSGFSIRWQNVFLKAQQGTFVPFTLAIESAGAMPRSALLYVRAVPRGAVPSPSPSRRRQSADLNSFAAEYPVDAIFPVELRPDASRVARVRRGFSIAPGDYDIYVVLRERANPATPTARPRAAVVAERLAVPDFWAGGLTTSTIIVADHLSILSEPVSDEDLVERPYVIGQNEVTPAIDTVFRRSEELVVVFLVYNPTVTTDKRFDVQVEYHFFRRVEPEGAFERAEPFAPHPPERAGEHYFNHTEPQRFSPAIMGSKFDPGAGHPLLAGQAVPLSNFELGEYRLAISVTDLLSGTLVTRDVIFTVAS